MQAYTETEIINGCRDNIRAFQEQLYKKYYSLFLKICARYAKDMEDAEQLLNDSFLKIFTRIGDYKNEGSFEGWMKRITINTCLDYLKSRYLKTSMQMQVNASMVTENLITTDQDTMRQIAFKELVKMIQALPPLTRTVFNLFVFDGFSHKEIAALLDISKGTSYWHVHQARNILQELIKKTNTQNPLYEHKRI